MNLSAEWNTALVGERLRLFRESLSMSQEQLAIEIDGSKRGVQDNEWGKTAPNSKALFRLALLGLNVNWLLLGEGEMLSANIGSAGQPDNVKLYADAMEAIDYLMEQKKKVATYQQRRALVDALYQASKKEGVIDQTMAAMIAKIAA